MKSTNMDLSELNLNQLLELGLRFPEIGVVDLNILYLILKAIIQNQGLETVTPQTAESPSDSKIENTVTGKVSATNEFNKPESNDESVKAEEKASSQKVDELCKDIQTLKLIIDQQTYRISELDKVPKPKYKEDDKQDTSHSAAELEIKIAVAGEKMGLKSKLADDEKPEESIEAPKQEVLQSKFSWHADKSLGANIESIKKKYESLKESDQKEYWLEMVEVQETNKMITKTFDNLTREFDIVVNRIGQLTTQVEELDKSVNKKVQIDNDLDKLKKQIERIDAYVFTGKPETGATQMAGTDTSKEEKESTEFVTGEVEKPKRIKDRTHFQSTVRNLMTMPEEKKAQIRKGSIQSDTKKVKPRTMKRAYELYLEATRKTRAGKDIPDEEEIEGEEVKKIDIDTPDGQEPKMGEAEDFDIDPFQQEENLVSDLVERKDSLPPIRRTTEKKFRRAAQAITLLQGINETHRFRKLPNIRKHVLRDSDDEEEIGHESDISSESLEIGKPLSKHASVEIRKSAPGKPTLLSGDQHLKEQIVLYVKTRLEKTEDKLMEHMQTLENSIVELQLEYESFKKEVDVLNTRMAKIEASQSRLEGRLTDVEKQANLNYLRIEEMMLALDKKADRSDTLLGVTRKDLCVLEKKMHEINEICLSDIEELKGFLKGYTARNQDELDKKMSGLEVNSRLEPLTGRLRRLEKSLKDVYFTVRVLESQFMGPIEVRRYLHCEDGKRIMPLERQVFQRTSASQHVKTSPFPDGVDSKKLEADLQKTLFDTVLRDSKRFIGGAYTKGKVAGT